MNSNLHGSLYLSITGAATSIGSFIMSSGGRDVVSWGFGIVAASVSILAGITTIRKNLKK